MPSLTYSEIYAEARDAITGDASGSTPADAKLTRTAQATVRELFANHPCLTDGAGGYRGTLTANELADFYRAAGYLTAAKWLSTPAGKTYASTTMVQLGPVRETNTGRTVEEIVSDAEAEAALCLGRIACVGDNFAHLGGVARSSRQIGCGEPGTVIAQMYGPCDAEGNPDEGSGGRRC